MPVPASASRLAAGGLMLALLAAVASPARAISAIPDEDAIQLSGERIRTAMVGDVDGDGVRELVRLLPWSVNPGLQAVEVLSAADGAIAARGDALVQRAATPDDAFAGRRPSPDNLLPLRTDEPALLIAWRDQGQERVLLASIGAMGLPRPCCLTLWQVTLEGGATDLTFIQDTVSSAASILAADMDDDGTDELVVLETIDPALEPFQSERSVMVLRWNGTNFDRSFGTAALAVAHGPLVWLGDSDGLPGNEVGFVGVPRFDQVTPTLYRISLDASGGVVIEHGILPADGEVAALPVEDGERLALVAEAGVSMLSWPSGAQKPLATGTSIRGGELLGVVGSDLETAILVRRGGAVDVLNTTPASRQGISIGIAAPLFMGDQRGLEPYVGPLPGGYDGLEPAYLFAGRLISAQPDDETATLSFVLVQNVATLAGTAPIGLFGPNLGWAATARLETPIGNRRGGLLEVVARAFATEMFVVPAELLLTPEADGGSFEPAISGAVQDVTRSIPTLLTGGQITATVHAPAGSVIHSMAVNPAEERSTATVALAGGMPIQLVQSTVDGRTFSVRLQVVTPAGHAYAAQWQARVVIRAPTLSVEVPFAPLGFEVNLTGQTDPGTEVLVDDAPASVEPDGSFSATVPAGLTPRTVQVSVTDQLGNATTQSVSVVALLDYRQLPWVPITATLTLLVAGFLYLRAPRTRQAPQTTDSGTLEELE